MLPEVTGVIASHNGTDRLLVRSDGLREVIFMVAARWVRFAGPTRNSRSHRIGLSTKVAGIRMISVGKIERPLPADLSHQWSEAICASTADAERCFALAVVVSHRVSHQTCRCDEARPMRDLGAACALSVLDRRRPQDRLSIVHLDPLSTDRTDY